MIERFQLRRVLRILGGNIRRLRIEAGLTQMETAERAALNLRHFQKVETAAVNATVSTIVGIARALDVDVATLFQPHQNGRAK